MNENKNPTSDSYVVRPSGKTAMQFSFWLVFISEKFSATITLPTRTSLSYACKMSGQRLFSYLFAKLKKLQTVGIKMIVARKIQKFARPVLVCPLSTLARLSVLLSWSNMYQRRSPLQISNIIDPNACLEKIIWSFTTMIVLAKKYGTKYSLSENCTEVLLC